MNKRTREEHISNLETIGCDGWTVTTEAYKSLQYAIQVLKQEPCEDAISRQAVIDLIFGQSESGFFTKNDIQSLPPVISVRRWFPVSERLPEKTGMYLISIGDLVTAKSFDGHNFRAESRLLFPDAWMPLPKPYKEA